MIKKIRIIDGRIYFDNNELDWVKSYKLETSGDANEPQILTLEIYVEVKKELEMDTLSI